VCGPLARPLSLHYSDVCMNGFKLSSSTEFVIKF
jgi:hypothetical protein